MTGLQDINREEVFKAMWTAKEGTLIKVKLHSGSSVHMRLKGQIGEGATSAVYVAYYNNPSDQKLKIAALKCQKIIPHGSLSRFTPKFILKRVFPKTKSPQRREDVHTEVKSLRKSQCPFVVKFLGYSLSTYRSWIASDCYAFDSVDVFTNSDGDLPLLIQYVLTAMLIGLRHLKQMKIVHRDIKPSNIRFDSKGVPKICDFGFACPEGTPHSETGTPFYICPEAFNGQEFSSMSDVFSLGVTVVVWSSSKPIADHMEDTRTWKEVKKSYKAIYGGLEEGGPISEEFLKPLSEVEIPENDAKDWAQLTGIVKNMIEIDIKKRQSVEDLLQVPFIHGFMSDWDKFNAGEEVSEIFDVAKRMANDILENIEERRHKRFSVVRN